MSPNYLKLLLLSLSITSLCFAEPSAPNAPSAPTSNSFLEYVPQLAEYQVEIHPVVTAYLDALKVPASDSAKQKAAFEKVVSVSKTSLKNLSRGFHDEIYLLGGLAYEKLGLKDNALNWHAKSVQLRSDNPVPLFRHALLLKEKGDCQRAITELEEVIWRTEDHAHETLYITSQCLVALEQNEQAAKVLRNAYSRNPQFVPVLRLLITTRAELLATPTEPAKLEALEQESIRDLTTITTQQPDERDASLQLARLLIKRSDSLVNANQLSQAETLAQNIAENSDYKDDEAVRVLIEARLKRREFVKAEKALALGLEKKPNSELLKSAAKQLQIEKQILQTGGGGFPKS